MGTFPNAAAQSFLVRDRNVIHWAPKRYDFVSLELTHGMRAPSEPSRSQDADSTLAAVAELILELEVGLGGAFCSGVADLIIIIKACMVPLQRNVKAALGQSEAAPLLLPDTAAKLAALPANVVQALHVSCCTPPSYWPQDDLYCHDKAAHSSAIHHQSRNTICRPLSLLWCLRR